MPSGYYSDGLSAARLRRCYAIAPVRVQQYLFAEIEHVRAYLQPEHSVLELGCGFGRVLEALEGQTGALVGIDSSRASLRDAKVPCRLVQMNAARLGFRDGSFDVVICIQNGISAFHENPRTLLREAVRVTRRGGIALFSSYTERFWSDRLQWFERQAAEGLIGEIDYTQTAAGRIVCKDGFSATTIRPDEFQGIAKGLGKRMKLVEVDGSSLFCEIHV